MRFRFRFRYWRPLKVPLRQQKRVYYCLFIVNSKLVDWNSGIDIEGWECNWREYIDENRKWSNTILQDSCYEWSCSDWTCYSGIGSLDSFWGGVEEWGGLGGNCYLNCLRRASHWRGYWRIKGRINWINWRN